MRRLGAMLIVVGLLSGCRSPQGGGATPDMPAARPSPAAVRVKAAKAIDRQVTTRVYLSGTVAADKSANLAVSSGGRVEFVGARLGDPVRAGQVMLRVSDPQAESSVAVSRAQLNESLTKVGMDGPLGENANPGDLPDVRKALAQLENAEQTYQQYLLLREEELVSDQTVADKRANYLNLKAQYEGALEQVHQNAAAVRTSRAQLAQAQQKLHETVVRAPFDGYVQQQGVEVGDFLQAGSASGLILVSSGSLYIMVDVPQEHVPKVTLGRTLGFRCDASKDLRLVARVDRLSPIVSPDTRSMQVRGRLVRPPGWLRPGMAGQVDLETAQPSSRVMVPESAILTQGGVSKVFVLRQGRVESREVELGPERSGWVAVSKVRVGEQVAASDLVALQNGMRVEVEGELPAPSSVEDQ